MNPTSTGPDIVCPVDQADLRGDAGSVVCTACGRRYPIREGVPDLLEPDLRLRVVVAGARGALLTDAVVDAVGAHPSATLAGVVLGRLDAARAGAADLLISAGHERWIPGRVRALPRLGAIGVHPSLLPRYRGSWPLWWALRHGEREVGVSLFHLVDALDAGPVIAQEAIPVRRGDTFASLYERTRPVVTRLVTSLLDRAIADGALPAGTPQNDSAASTYPTPGLRDRIALRAELAVRAAVARGTERP